MDDSPFRRIVLPALLAASAGFAALTWPAASAQRANLFRRLPQPLNTRVDSALTTSQHKEFSIGYVGFAVLASVGIGGGTAGSMGRQQVRIPRHQGQSTPELPPEAPALASPMLSTPIESHQIYQIRGSNQHYYLAIKMGGEYYRFYRQRPSLERTQALVQQLQRRGQRAIATRDGSGYVVWVYQPAPIDPISSWSELLAAH